MSEEQFSDHHRSTSFDFVHVEVETLHIGAVFERFGKILSTLTLDSVAHQVQIQKSHRLTDQIAQGTRTNIRDTVVSEVNLFNVNGVSLESRADHDQMIVSDSISEHVLVVSMDDDVDRIVFIVGLLEILNESIVRLQTSLL